MPQFKKTWKKLIINVLWESFKETIKQNNNTNKNIVFKRKNPSTLL